MKLIKIPFSGGGLGHGDGSNMAPDKILERLKDKFSNEEGIEPKFIIEQIEVDEKNIGQSHDNIQDAISKIKKNAILLGGDHSITYPAVKGFSKNTSEFMLIIFDAHPDLMDDFKPPTQEDYLKVLIEENIVKPENIIIIGVRNWDKIEIDYLKKKNILYYDMKTIFDKDVKQVTKNILIKIKESNLPIYLSLDIDAVDPVEAIGTGYTEHGGLSSREIIHMIQQIKSTDLIKISDIVEVNPKKDINDMTSGLAAKLIMELS